MHPKPVLAKAMLALVAAGLVLPIVISVLVALCALLANMGDPSGSRVLACVALACGIGWLVVLICLLLVQGVHALSEADEEEQPR